MAPIAYLNVLKTKREILSLQAERDNERKKPCVSSKKKKRGRGQRERVNRKTIIHPHNKCTFL